MTSSKAKVTYRYADADAEAAAAAAAAAAAGEDGEAAAAADAAEAELVDITAWSTAPGNLQVLSRSDFEKATVPADAWHSVAVYVAIGVIILPLYRWWNSPSA